MQITQQKSFTRADISAQFISATNPGPTPIQYRNVWPLKIGGTLRPEAPKHKRHWHDIDRFLHISVWHNGRPHAEAGVIRQSEIDAALSERLLGKHCRLSARWQENGKQIETWNLIIHRREARAVSAVTGKWIVSLPCKWRLCRRDTARRPAEMEMTIPGWITFKSWTMAMPKEMLEGSLNRWLIMIGLQIAKQNVVSEHKWICTISTATIFFFNNNTEITVRNKKNNNKITNK